MHSGSLEDFIVLLRPKPEYRLRMDPASPLPKWFAYPIARSGYRVHLSRSLAEIRKIVGAPHAFRPLVLVFNVSLLEWFITLVLRRRCRIISLYQWRAFEHIAPLKRFICRTVLSASEQLLVYSKLAETSLRDRFPNKPVRWMGLYTDTAFFRPQPETQSLPLPARFLLVPGNHKRDERLVCDIAERLQIPIIRFSSSPLVFREYDARACRYVTLLKNLPFHQVRELYQRAAVVLNVVDDSQWPVGITTFSEGLAMNATIITPSGHSASGYQFEDGTRPYYNVVDFRSVSEWCDAARHALKFGHTFFVNRSPRALAERLCSLEAVVATWSSLSRAAHHS